MLARGRALVGFAVLTLLVNVMAGSRLHAHPGHHDEHGRALVHSHGTGAPHSHRSQPASPTEQNGDGGDHDAVIVMAALRALPSPIATVTVTAPTFLPEPVVVAAVPNRWSPAPDVALFHAHGPPASPLLPVRAPPSAPRQIS